jgi:hypothetical protein
MVLGQCQPLAVGKHQLVDRLVPLVDHIGDVADFEGARCFVEHTQTHAPETPSGVPQISFPGNVSDD